MSNSVTEFLRVQSHSIDLAQVLRFVMLRWSMVRYIHSEISPAVVILHNLAKCVFSTADTACSNKLRGE